MSMESTVALAALKGASVEDLCRDDYASASIFETNSSQCMSDTHGFVSRLLGPE